MSLRQSIDKNDAILRIQIMEKYLQTLEKIKQLPHKTMPFGIKIGELEFRSWYCFNTELWIIEMPNGDLLDTSFVGNIPEIINNYIKKEL